MEFLSNQNVIFYLLAYLIGGIPFGLILAKTIAKVNIKESGSGSIGATNVLRVVKEKDPSLGKKLAIATLVFDALKGVLILIVAKLFGLPVETLWAIAILAVFGHCYSIFLGFEGGKGVATGVGVLFFMLPIETIIGVVAWAISIKTTKISSLSSLIGLFVLVVSSFIIHPEIYVIKTHAPVVIIAFIILYKHIPNIVKLIKGEEKKIVWQRFMLTI